MMYFANTSSYSVKERGEVDFFIFFKFGCAGSLLLLLGLSLVAKSRGCSLVAVGRLLIGVVSLVVEHGP